MALAFLLPRLRVEEVGRRQGEAFSADCLPMVSSRVSFVRLGKSLKRRSAIVRRKSGASWRAGMTPHERLGHYGGGEGEVQINLPPLE